MNILIVDDIVTNRKLLRVTLEAESHTTLEAADGVEALQILGREKVEAIISDVLMPGMDGYRLCYEIRRHQKWRALPFLFYTATYTSPSDEKLALDLGADAFFIKPSPTGAIVAKLNQVIATNDRSRPRIAMAEADVLKEYSERMVVKLEQKCIELSAQTEMLRATQRRLQQILEQSPAVIYNLTIEGQNVIPTFVSENVQRVLGVAVGESMISDWWVNSLHLEDRDRMLATLANGLKEGGYTAEYRLRHQDGTYRWVLDNNRVIRDADGAAQEIVGVWTDITERKQAQSQRLRAQRLESLGTLAGGISHDLNNALTPIMMATELLRLEFPGVASQYVEVIQAGARRGADMVKQLLSYAKGTEGERLLIQPRHLLKEIVELIRITFPKNIKLRTNFAKDLPTILGDATQLHQVLLNLCVNARDAMPGGGTLTLKADLTEIDATSAGTVAEARPGSYVAWSVTDTGTGIPPEILDHIFEPFFSTKGPDKGTGLGLSTVTGIVKSHGGFVQVNSVPGQGSTFTVLLPPAGPSDGDASLQKSTEVMFRGNGETVLVVDDEAPVRNILRTVLTKLNFKVLTASDGTAALIQVAEKRAELRVVITDLQMPHMDGLSFVRVLKARLPNASIIVASGLVEQAMADEFEKLGVLAMLAKPFSQEELVKTLKKVFQQSNLSPRPG